jgi:hypothetical protein
MFPFESDLNEDDHAFTLEGSAPAFSSGMTPNKISSENLCTSTTQDASQVVAEESSSPTGTTLQDSYPSSATTPPYQKRGRFLVWPVSMEPPQLSIPLFGLARQ